MREFCLTEEVIQQFIDGELSPEQTESAATHLSACRACAALLSEVEAENSLLSEALAPELSLSVPTLSLRERLDAAIAELEPRRPMARESFIHRLGAWFGSLSFTPQQSLGFASLAIVLAFAAIFAVIQLRGNKENPAPTVAGNRVPQVQPTPEKAAVIGDETPKGTDPAPVGVKSVPRVVKVRDNDSLRRSAVKRVNEKPGVKPESSTAPKAEEPKILPGERNYLEAIATLTTAIEVNKGDVLKPTVLADYERNLAVVDQAIASTRQQVKRNPKDREAAEFMYMAYQNKIELLSAVADQTRLASR